MKPLATSPPVAFRLPLDLWPELQRRADLAGVTPHAFARALVVESLTVSDPVDGNG